MQDQAPLGTEAGIAIPDGQGGVDLYATSQFVHVDHEQVVASLGLRPRTGQGASDRDRGRVRGEGGRQPPHSPLHARPPHGSAGEDGLPARRVVYGTCPPPSGLAQLSARGRRKGSSHPGGGQGHDRRRRLCIDHGGGRGQCLLLRSRAVPLRLGAVDGIGVRTNNPPCGAMRGFGAVQVLFRPRGADGPPRRCPGHRPS